jgi:hypothetical protein
VDPRRTACRHSTTPDDTSDCEGPVGSVIKKRRKRMAKKKHRKLLRRTRHQRRNKK